MEEEVIQRMKALMYGIFELIDITGITIHTTKEGTIILSDEKIGYHREVTQEGIKAIHEDYWKNLRQ